MTEIVLCLIVTVSTIVWLRVYALCRKTIVELREENYKYAMKLCAIEVKINGLIHCAHNMHRSPVAIKLFNSLQKEMEEIE